jgi:hypothetical protein
LFRAYHIVGRPLAIAPPSSAPPAELASRSASRAEGGDDLVGTETSAGGQRHPGSLLQSVAAGTGGQRATQGTTTRIGSFDFTEVSTTGGDGRYAGKAHSLPAQGLTLARPGAGR